MQTVTRSPFTSVKTEGGLLPADLLQRIADGDNLPGLRPVDYHLYEGERVNEAVNRAWNRCVGAWKGFKEQSEKIAATDSGTSLTRERWLLVLFQELGYGRLPALRSGLTAGDTTFPISHLWQTTPIHLVTFRQGLDQRSEVSTAVKRTPHSLMQEFLNRSPEHQWGIIANGLTLRILRDNASMRRAAFVEFDLASIMQYELYAEFALLWMVCHQSRFERLEIERLEIERLEIERLEIGDDENEPSISNLQSPISNDCWLERWSKLASERGTRAMDALRDGVKEAVEALGSGFLAHRENEALRTKLREGALRADSYYHQLRRMVYRLIFLAVAEDRDLLLLPETSADIKQLYSEHYSLRRLRTMSAVLRGGPHPDLHRQLRLLFVLVREGYPGLGLPGLGSFLFSDRSTPDLDNLELANQHLLAALRALSFTVEGRVRRAVDFRNLDSEELGSIYQSLLELHPEVNLGAATFVLNQGAGSERKTTGSHYTPTSLVESLLDTALEPVVAERLEGVMRKDVMRKDVSVTSYESRITDYASRITDYTSPAEAAILSIKVLDAACGSGHMLIGAGRRLARRLARIRTGEDEPSPGALRAAMRDVVRHCLYGVDLNDMAVELCKVALWMESLEPGKPLSFLDAHIQCGNSLIGVTPGLDISEIPDDAFQPVTGDDKATATGLRRRNKKEREGQLALDFAGKEQEDVTAQTAAWRAQQMAVLGASAEDDVAQVHAKETAYAAYLKSEKYRWSRLECDVWTAAFFWPMAKGDPTTAAAPTQAVLQDVRAGKLKRHEELLREVQRIAKQHQFFHWALQYPDVFQRAAGGFDVILMNPPWERIKLQEKEWFAARSPAIASASNAAERKRMIAALQAEDPAMWQAFQDDLGAAENESLFIRNSGRYPLCGRGDVNTYAVFAELVRLVLSPAGRVGIIVPTGIATDDTTKFYFQVLMAEGHLSSLFSFWETRRFFEGTDSRGPFCLLTLTGQKHTDTGEADFVFDVRDFNELYQSERHFTLTAGEIALLNPNTRTCPLFRSKRDAELTKTIYGKIPVFKDEQSQNQNGWMVTPHALFHMSGDSSLFGTTVASDKTRLYEAKMIHQFDHRWNSYQGIDHINVTTVEKSDPHFAVCPRYWLPSATLDERLGPWQRGWLVSYRRIARNTDERTTVVAVIPRTATADPAMLLMPSEQVVNLLSALVANLNSFCLDYIARQKLGGTDLRNHFLYQFAVIPPKRFESALSWDALTTPPIHWFSSRVLELTYTAWDLQPFARDCGYDGPPFRWDEDRRFLLRCELDAAYFHLYGIERDDVDYIMETFPIVKRKDIARHGEYRTKRVILEMYDDMAIAIQGGAPYVTRLDPPPADARVAHGGVEDWQANNYLFHGI
jgi:hypothetical protein